MTIGEQIKELREKNNVSQERLAEALQVSRQTVSSWERGEKFPTKKNIERLAAFFKIPENYFFGMQGNAPYSAPVLNEEAKHTLTPLTKDETAVADSDCPPPNAPSVTPESESKSSKNSKKKIVIPSIFFFLGLLIVLFAILADRLRYLEIKKERDEGWNMIETFTISTTDWLPLIIFIVGVVLVVVCGGVLIWHFIKRKKEIKNHEKKK